MTAAELRPTLLNSCARATTAAEACYRINAPLDTIRASRIVALDQDAAGIIRRIVDLPWSDGVRFLLFEEPVSADDLDGLQTDATLRTVDGATSMLSDELTDADVAVMVATADAGARAALVIGQACFVRGIMTAGLVVAEGGMAEQALAALRPHAMVLVVTTDEDDVPEMLGALRV